MKHSIRTRLFWSVFAVIIFFVLFSCFLNLNYLGRFYVARKTHQLVRSYHLIDRAYSGDPGEIQFQLERMTRTTGVSVIVLGKNYEMKYSSSPHPPGRHRFRIGLPDPRISMIIELASRDPQSAYQVDILREPMLNTRFLNLAARLHNGDYLWLGTPLAEIQDSAAIANRFALLTGLLSIIVGGIMIFFFARKFTQPILELNQMAQDMARLEFSGKYRGDNRDEIGELGQSINSLSEQLGRSITELREANSHLEQENEHRRKIDEMRKEFISNVSHELKTPLALVQGYAEGLELNIAGDEKEKDYYCHVIRDETEKMDRLVRTLLDLSEIDSGYYRLEKERLDLAEMMGRVLGKYKLMLGEKGINLEYRAAEGAFVFADATRIEQVINNFLSNAMEHMDEGKRLKITVEKREASVRLAVFNSGLPIPEDALEQIWGSFFKVDKARTRSYGGTGLGLSIVRAIIDLHQGSYGVQNFSDGVEFWVELGSD